MDKNPYATSGKILPQFALSLSLSRAHELSSCANLPNVTEHLQKNVPFPVLICSQVIEFCEAGVQ